MDPNRRTFIKNSSLLLGTGLIANPFSALPTAKDYTVGEIMELFIANVPNAPLANTVDTLKTGHREQIVTGIVTTMFATITVIKKAIALKANFIIVHEPTFYNHADDTDWLAADPVYQFKRKLLEENGIAVWRNHDYVHRLPIDGVQAGVVKELGWERYYNQNPVLNIPEITLSELISHIKTKMKVPAIRYVGDLSQKVSKVLLLPGAVGGRRQIEALIKEKPDVLICGETPEWETPEYVRNANEIGEKLGMVVIGHSASEEAGSEFVAEWIGSTISGMPVFHVPSGNSLNIN